MFEKWRIKEHMEVIDTTGRHVATVDSIDGDDIKLTRQGSPDGQHHYLDVSSVERVEDGRVYLNADLIYPDDPVHGAANSGMRSDMSGKGYAGNTDEGVAPDDPPLFGTSGRGTGMGGSGVV